MVDCFVADSSSASGRKSHRNDISVGSFEKVEDTDMSIARVIAYIVAVFLNGIGLILLVRRN